MNQLPKKTNSIFKNLLVILISVGIFFFLVSLMFAYVLRKIPHYENFYPFVPWLVSVLCAVFLAFIAKTCGKDSVLITLVSSAIIGGLFFAIGLFWGIAPKNFALVLSRNVLFVISSVLLSLYLSRKKQNRRTSGKKFKFSK